MKFSGILWVGLMLVFSSCDYYVENSYSNHIGLVNKPFFGDNNDFSPCFEERIFPFYYGEDKAGYPSDKNIIKNYFKAHFDNQGYVNENSIITIQFIINCKGEIGRFKIHQFSYDYHKKSVNKKLTYHLLELIKQFDQWTNIAFYKKSYDAFFHLSFKIKNGEIVEILP